MQLFFLKKLKVMVNSHIVDILITLSIFDTYVSIVKSKIDEIDHYENYLSKDLMYNNICVNKSKKKIIHAHGQIHFY